MVRRFYFKYNEILEFLLLFVIFTALGEAQAKITVYEKELGSAQKTIGKSKKAQEVQQLYKDNESLQYKLRCTEEEFRMQNQTLLEELSKVSHHHLGVGPSRMGFLTSLTTGFLKGAPSCSNITRVFS